jgi:hypothetical protein
MMNRRPPKSVRQILRREVGLCCPVADCGSPYLTYHHFDPPWNVCQHHNPDGMIALCEPHHSQADGGVFTIDQLQKLKATAKTFAYVRGQFNWRRENTLIIIGGSYVIDTPQILCIQNKPLLWLTKSVKGNDLINIDLRDPTGKQLFSMRDNEWLALPPVDDIIAPPQTRSLSIRSKSTSVSLDVQFAAEQSELIRKRIMDSFPPQATETFRNRVQQILKGYFLTGEILVCRIACETMWPERVSVKYDRILLESNTLRGSMSIQNPTAIAIRCTRNTGAGFAFG